MRHRRVLPLVIVVICTAVLGAAPAAIGVAQDQQTQEPGFGVHPEILESITSQGSGHDLQVIRFHFQLPMTNIPPDNEVIPEPMVIFVESGVFQFSVEPNADFNDGDVIIDPSPMTPLEDIDIDPETQTPCSSECVIPPGGDQERDFNLEPGSWIFLKEGAGSFCYACYIGKESGTLVVSALPPSGTEFSWLLFARSAAGDQGVAAASLKAVPGRLNPGCQGRG